MWIIDRQYVTAMEKPGVDPTPAPEDFEGIGYLVTVLWFGAIEEDWVVEDLGKAERQAEALTEEFEGDEFEVWIDEVYVDDEVVENTGYMSTRRYRANPGFLGRILGF